MSMGYSEFWPLTESKSVSRLKQNSAQLITSARGPLNQIRYKSIHWGLLGIWVKYNVFVPFFIYLYLFFWDSRTSQTVWWIFTRDSSLDVKSCKDVLFRVIKLKFNIKPLFIPKTVKLWPKTHWTVFFAWKCLTMGELKSKLPLIIIVAP